MSGKRFRNRSRAIALAALAGMVLLGWFTGRWLPLDWGRMQKDPPPTAAVSELPLDEQIAAVARRTSGTIHVALRPMDGADVAEICQLQGLQVLLLDHAGNSIGDEECQSLAKLSELVHLRVRGGNIGDEGLACLAALPKLRILNLPHSLVTNRGLEVLTSASGLRQLRLGSRHITDDGLKSLSGFPALRQLHLIDAPITDAGLKTIAALPELESLYLDGSRVTDAGLEWLFRARPDLHVHINQQHHDRDPNRDHP